MKLLITGDFVVNQTYNPSQINKELIELFGQSDYNIVNLEAPVTKSTLKILKTGPHLKSDRGSTEKVLKVLNINMCNLANNHILDYGEQGVLDTLNFCHKNGIETVGAGKDKNEASNIHIIDRGDIKIGILNIAENEWASATNSAAGANGMDIIDDIKLIKSASKKVDVLILVIHGGNEYTPYPSPRMVKQYRFYAENGANVIVGHHTHCISGYEIYNGVPIFYSLGNFLFTTNLLKSNSWYYGLVLSLTINKFNSISFEIIPVIQNKITRTISLANNESKHKIISDVNEVNRVILHSKQLVLKWEEYVQKVMPSYIKSISPLGGIRNRYIKAAIYKTGLYKYLLHETYIKEVLNRIRCEAHNDVVINALKIYHKRCSKKMES